MRRITKEQLEQIRTVKSEIDRIAAKLEALRGAQDMSSDIVKGSDPEWPYCLRSYRITGIDHGKIDRLVAIYQRKMNQLNDYIIEAEQWLDTVDDSVIRQIVRLRFLENNSWAKTAKLIYGKPYENVPRMAISRYFERNS